MGDLCPRCLEDRDVCLCRTATGCVDLDTARRMLWVVPGAEREYCDRTRGQHRIEKEKAGRRHFRPAFEPPNRVEARRAICWVQFYPASPLFPSTHTRSCGRGTTGEPMPPGVVTETCEARYQGGCRAGMVGRRVRASKGRRAAPTRSLTHPSVRPSPGTSGPRIATTQRAMCKSNGVPLWEDSAFRRFPPGLRPSGNGDLACIKTSLLANSILGSDQLATSKRGGRG